jgi:hypothetical protein
MSKEKNCVEVEKAREMLKVIERQRREKEARQNYNIHAAECVAGFVYETLWDFMNKIAPDRLFGGRKIEVTYDYHAGYPWNRVTVEAEYRPTHHTFIIWRIELDGEKFPEKVSKEEVIELAQKGLGSLSIK